MSASGSASKWKDLLVWAASNIPWLSRRSIAARELAASTTFFSSVRNLGSVPAIIRHRVSPGSDCHINFAIFSDETKHNKALIQVKFYDERRKLIPQESYGLTIARLGAVIFLPTSKYSGTVNQIIRVPDSAVEVRLAFFGWFNRAPISISKLVTISCSNQSRQFLTINRVNDRNRERLRIQQQLTQFLGESSDMPVMFIFSGTTYIQNVRVNRPMHLAKGFAQRGYRVIFSYHRFNQFEENPAPQASLMQLPSDLLPDLMDSILQRSRADGESILMVSYPHPMICRWLGKFRLLGWKQVYDCRDDWEEFAKVGKAGWYEKSAERFVAQQVDTVTCVSEKLQQKMKHLAAQAAVEVVPNAVTEDFAIQPQARKPSESIVVGYFGHLTAAWFDWPLVIELAEKNPHWTLELIGHDEPSDLSVPDNIKLLGPRDRKELPQATEHWSVAIIPFTLSSLTESVDPIKVYEYLALGLPVVSRPMSQIANYPFVKVASSADEFNSVIHRQSEATLDSKLLAGWVENNTWTVRTEAILDLIAS